jgi:hypothetical protein
LARSNEKLVGRDGHLNASNKQDLAKIIAGLMEVAGTQHVVTETAAVMQEKRTKEHREAVTAAFDNKSELIALGEVMAEELYATANRQGFQRRLLSRQDLAQGSIPTVKMAMKNVVGITAGSASKVETQLIRDNFYYPTEFYIEARPYIEQRDLVRSRTDMLEEKYVESLEALMVQEDRTFIKLAQASIGIENSATNLIGYMSAVALGTLRNQVTRWGIPAAFWLIANDVWIDLLGADFNRIVDPVSEHEVLLTGQLGTVMGMQVISDAFRFPTHKVLNAGDMYIFGDPVNLGQYTDRGGIESLPIDGTQESIPGRGWFMSELISMIITNARGVAYASRIL